jgi:hypothetical protein
LLRRKFGLTLLVFDMPGNLLPQIHQARTLYENIVPNHTIYDVECPDQNFRKFTNDGQYLICFSRNHQDLIVYRHKWLSFCVKGEACDQPLELPAKAKKFDSHFSQLYSIPLASGGESICKDFFLSTENGLYGIFATSTIPDNSNPPTDGAVPGVPSTEKITIFLVRYVAFFLPTLPWLLSVSLCCNQSYHSVLGMCDLFGKGNIGHDLLSSLRKKLELF